LRLPIQVNAGVFGGALTVRSRAIYGRYGDVAPVIGELDLPAMKLSRRQALTLTASAAAASAAAALAPWPATARTMSELLSPGRTPYGACIRPIPLQDELDYRNLVQTCCQQVTPEGALVWAHLRPTPTEFRFEDADSLLAFAEANGMTMRGHTLVWYGAMPDWTKTIAGAAATERAMTDHIEKVMGRYRGKVKTWHVVNEPIDDAKGDVPGLRPSLWLANLGDKYIDLAFRTAHRVDPACKLVLNEYDLESIDGTSPKKREAFRRLIHSLLDRDVPLHGIGLQGHIRGQYQIDRDGLFAFVAELHSLGLAVHVTELDVIDNALPGPSAMHDALVATRAYDFLEPIVAAARPEIIATWGITDRHTWVPIWNKRKDGLPNRPLPFDANCQPKPLWNVIDYYCNK
jgi:endo-1,4-beta-xylanase